ncbi:MAG: hypothetical protein HYY24_10425 [Verrucomicrobia bacterium]|nr:hypothetical protein [Verrucomicrobiota bacterium]
MLTIPGQSFRFCDGVSRRNFLEIGVLGLGGLALTDLLRAEDQSCIRKSHRAIIMVYLPGGPPHQRVLDSRCLRQRVHSRIQLVNRAAFDTVSLYASDA